VNERRDWTAVGEHGFLCTGTFDPTELEVIRDVLPHVQTPVQVASGRRDIVVPAVNAEYALVADVLCR
jgi:hypothetical protein